MDQVEQADDKDLPSIGKRWKSEIEIANKKEADWRERGQKVLDRYHDDRKNGTSKLNILWANTEIRGAALYSRTPTPDVRRRYKDQDKTGKEVALLLERALEYSIDEYDFDHEVQQSIDHAQLPGRGVLRVRYIPEISSVDTRLPVEMQTDIVIGDDGAEEVTKYFSEQGEIDPAKIQEDDEGIYTLGEPEEEVTNEQVQCEVVDWEDYRQSPAKRWNQVRWVAFHHSMTRDELEQEFGKRGKDIPLTMSRRGDDEKTTEEEEYFKQASVWEIWNKDDKEVIFIAMGMEEAIEVRDDPLQLTGFFPVARPLHIIRPKKNLVPIPEYTMYQDQAEELDDITGRISKLIEALKVKGVYDASMEGLGALIESDDRALVPVENWATLVNKGGLDGVVSWMPVEQIARVLQGLYEQRDRLINTIFELTGISDIVRGQSDPRETATAQGIKNRSNALRLGPTQKEIQRFARDILRLKAEIMARFFEPETLQRMTGREVTQEMIQLLRDDGLRSYRIDIETDSTIAEDLADDKQEVTEFLNAMTNYFQQIGPLITQGLLPFEVGKSMLMFAARRFKTSKELEDALETLQQPQQQGGESQIDEIAMADVQRQTRVSYNSKP